jgi:hypothetical protein
MLTTAGAESSTICDIFSGNPEADIFNAKSIFTKIK